jgi:uncharacterized protein YjbI with pentapeptide repeats
MKIIRKNRFSDWVKTHSKIVGGVAAGLVVGAAGSAVVVASIPDANGVVHGCFRTNNGSLRIIDSAVDTCTGNETALNWNQTGPQGPAGPTGPQGPAGSGGPGEFVDNLVGADFTSASLQYRNFADADMHDAIFDTGWINGSDFTGANMAGVRMSNTNAQKANFTNVDFTGAELHPASFADSVFVGANFTDVWLRNAGYADYSGLNFTDATLSGVFFSANFSDVDFRTVSFGTGDDPQLSFDGSNLTNADFRGIDPIGIYQNANSDLTDADFTGANLTDAQFVSSTNLFQTDFTNANLTNASFANSGLSNANLTGVTWSNTTCPDFTNSDNNGGTCIGHLDPL